VKAIFRERDRVRDLARYTVDRDRDADAGEKVDDLPVELRHGLRGERERPNVSAARAGDEPVLDEVELDLEDLVAGRHRRGGKAARADVERHLPAVVQPRREREAHLADDLRPELERRRGVAPPRVGELGPDVRRVAHGSRPAARRRASAAGRRC
jgi:hypothetical protein